MAVKKPLVQYDGVLKEVQVDDIIDVNTLNGHTASATSNLTEKTDLIGMVNELFQSASNLKTNVANAIGSPTVSTETGAQIATDITTCKTTIANNLTTKGVTASNTETLSALGAKILNITGNPYSGSASIADVILGKTFINAAGIQVGGMPTKVGSNEIYTVKTTDQIISKGYRGGVTADGIIKGEPNLLMGNIRSGSNIGGVPGGNTIMDISDGTVRSANMLNGIIGYGTSSGYGMKFTGNIPNNVGTDTNPSSIDGTSTAGVLKVKPSLGYYEPGNAIKVVEPNFVPPNIPYGLSMFGLTGSKQVPVSGTANWVLVSGSGTAVKYTISVTLPTTPKYVLISHAYANPYATCSGEWYWYLDSTYSQANATDATKVYGLIRKEQIVDSTGLWYSGYPTLVNSNFLSTGLSYPGGKLTTNGFILNFLSNDTAGNLGPISYIAIF